MPVTVRPGAEMAAVRFGPGAAPPVLGAPADALRDGRVPLRELWGGAADGLAERVAACGSLDERREALVAGVAARAAGPVDPLVGPVVAGLARGSVREVADALGLGERQLRRRSLAAFGYGPKVLQRVLRIQRALALARSGVALADVAVAVGYADQAHFANDVRALAGEPVRALL
jgi:AraC-like DNA-binding protein